jgi:hypothetical protein
MFDRRRRRKSLPSTSESYDGLARNGEASRGTNDPSNRLLILNGTALSQCFHHFSSVLISNDFPDKTDDIQTHVYLTTYCLQMVKQIIEAKQ